MANIRPGRKSLLALATAAALTVVPLQTAFAVGDVNDDGPVEIYGLERADAIPDRYIVVVKDGIRAQRVSALQSDVEDSGGDIHYEYSSAIKGFAASLSQEGLAEVLDSNDVDYVEVDFVASVSATQSPATWGLDRIDQRALPLSGSYTYDHDGAGVD